MIRRNLEERKEVGLGAGNEMSFIGALKRKNGKVYIETH